MKAQSTIFETVLPKKLEKILSIALRKLKNVWLREGVHSGIRFYIEAEE